MSEKDLELINNRINEMSEKNCSKKKRIRMRKREQMSGKKRIDEWEENLNDEKEPFLSLLSFIKFVSLISDLYLQSCFC